MGMGRLTILGVFVLCLFSQSCKTNQNSTTSQASSEANKKEIPSEAVDSNLVAPPSSMSNKKGNIPSPGKPFSVKEAKKEKTESKKDNDFK